MVVTLVLTEEEGEVAVAVYNPPPMNLIPLEGGGGRREQMVSLQIRYNKIFIQFSLKKLSNYPC